MCTRNATPDVVEIAPHFRAADVDKNDVLASKRNY